MWTDGSFVLDELSGLGSVGAVFTLSSLVLVGLVVGGGIWSCCLLAILVSSAASCSTRFVVLFSLFSVLSFGVVILALQCSSAVHLGVDNLNVVCHVSRILDGHVGCKLFELAIDLLTVIEKIILQRCVQSVRISKVTVHTHDDMVAVGRVRVEDKVGNDLADRAADFGRRRVSDLAMDVRRRFVSACSLWYTVILELRLMRMGALG